MQVDENKDVTYEFGNFVLDVGNRVLLVSGQTAHLPAKEFETLLVLVRSGGRSLSKEELIAAVWNDSFVEEGNLAKQVSRLRKVLEAGGGAHYIETIPKYGYRFTADVRAISVENPPMILEKRTVKRMTVAFEGDAARPSTPVGQPGPTIAPRDRRNRILVIVSLLIVSVAVLAFYRFYSSSSERSGIGSIRSIAVLPFKMMNGENAEDPYLMIGISEALTTKLSNLKRIVVRPTSAVRGYADRDSLTAGRELSVDAVLEGSVQRIDNRVRVSVQLISVSDGGLLWGEAFDEEFVNIFNLQDAISDQVARKLEPGLTGEERNAIAKRQTTVPEAHDAYVKGRFYWNRRTRADIKLAIDHFNEAVSKDPGYARAYAGLADAYSLYADYGGVSPAETYGKARDAAVKALELDGELAEAHASLAFINMSYYWEWQAAEKGFRRSISLNPNYATARQWYSEYLTAMGRFDEALDEIRRAREIDPLSPIVNSGEVWTLYYARRYDEAIAQGRKIAELNPAFAEVHEYLKRCHDQKGAYREAIASRQMRRKLAGLDFGETDALRSAASATTATEYWRQRLRQEIDESAGEDPETFDMAEIHAQAGEKDKALDWLEKAYAERHYAIIYLKVAPNLDPLRSDARFVDILRRVGFGS